MRDIGTRIKERRLQLGLSAEELAPLVGLSAATIYRYENGGIKKVDTTKLQPFAKALKTSESYLMGWVDDPNEPLKREAASGISASGLSPAALAVAHAYDKMSGYGRSMIDKIVENEKKYKIVNRLPTIEEAYGINVAHDSDLYARYNAMREQKELDQEQESENKTE